MSWAAVDRTAAAATVPEDAGEPGDQHRELLTDHHPV